MQDDRKLRAWKQVHALVLNVRAATSGFPGSVLVGHYRFPRGGYAALRNQMTTAAESIAFNIVEGCGSSGGREFARFLEIAIKSTVELEYQLRLAHDYGIIPEALWEGLSDRTVDTRRMLYGLRKKVLAHEAAPTDPSRSVVERET